MLKILTKLFCRHDWDEVVISGYMLYNKNILLKERLGKFCWKCGKVTVLEKLNK